MNKNKTNNFFFIHFDLSFYLFAEDGDNCKPTCGCQGGAQTHEVKGDLGQSGDGHATHDGEEGEIGEGGVLRAQHHPCDYHREDWHGSLHCVRV